MNKHLKIFNTKIYIVLYITLMLGILVPTFSGATAKNVWVKFLDTISNEWLIIATIISIILIINRVYSIYHNVNIIARFNDLKEFRKEILKTITKNVILYLFFVMFISFFFSIIISKFNFSTYYYSYYDINLIIYEVFFAIRFIVIVCLVSIILYFVMARFGSVTTIIFSIILMIINLVYYQMPFLSDAEITSFIKIPFFFISYLKLIEYSSFWLEICGTLIQLLILIALIIVLDYITTQTEQKDKLK